MSDLKPNDKQQECIDNTDGKYLVLAGPGTGKTFTVIERMKSIIKKGANPERILALTFSDAAANEMKKRLDNELGELDSGVFISTYHSFCLDIIKDHPQDFELPENYKVISDTVKIKFIRECIKELEPKAYVTEKNDPFYFVDTLIKQIKAIKEYRLSKQDFFNNIKTNLDWEPELKRATERLSDLTNSGRTIPNTAVTDVEKAQKNIAKAHELWQFYELYKSKMEAEHYIDFNDMINFVLDKFDSDGSFLKEVANEYDYLFVDEYQDTNKSQNEIIIKLAQNMDSGNIFLVGDDDQLIYTFQGAKLDTMENFLNLFPETKVICLHENMRSTQNILDFSREIAKLDTKRLEANPKFEKKDICKKLDAKNEEIIKLNKPIRLFKYFNPMQEMSSIIDEIEQLINSDDCPKDKNGKKDLSEIAILTTSNGELESYAQMLKNRNIRYELKEGKNIFLIKSSLVLYYYMKMLVSPELYSDKLFKVLLLPPFSINSKDYETLSKYRSKNSAFIDTMKTLDISEFIDSKKIKKFISIYDYLQEYRTNETLKNVVLEIGSKTGIFDYFINSEINQNENIAGIKKIIDEAVNYSDTTRSVSLDNFVEYLDMAHDGDTVIKTDKAPVKLNAVQLSTYHSSKGREFAYVYMPALCRSKWESSTKSYKAIIPVPPSEYKTKEELSDIKLSDNIKVMYVGMTRARHCLRLSYCETAGGKTTKLSRLILDAKTNIQKDILEEKVAPEFDENEYWLGITKEFIKCDYDYSIEFHSTVDAKLKDKSYSPTAINMYLRCPRQYFYEYILGLPAKDGNADNRDFGNAVHWACEKSVKYAIENGYYPDKEQFIKYFVQKLNSMNLSSQQSYGILQGRGEKVLEKFYVQFCNTPVSELYKAEYELNFSMEGINFHGYVDRIDKNSDGTYSIYDYKTGKAKNENIICINGEHEDYYNQIALYKYFFEKEHNCKVKSTKFIFPEECEKNLELELTDDDCQAVVDKFMDAINDIKNYEFEPIEKRERKTSTACEYCQYKDFCNFNVV